MSPAAFRKRAERAFRHANPDAAGATITWTHGPVSVKWADGSAGISGTFRAEAEGYRARSMHASLLGGEVVVR